MYGRTLMLFRWAAMVLSTLCAVVSGAQAENLVPNSSFEAGIDYRLAVGRWYVDSPRSARLDKTTSVHGSVSLKIPYSRTANTPGDHVVGVSVRSAMPVPVKQGRQYTFSVYAKSDRPGTGRIMVGQGAPTDSKAKPVASNKIQLTRKWRRVSMSFTAKQDDLLYWSISKPSRKPGHLWLDAVQLAEGKLRKFAVAAPVEAALTSDRLGRIFSPSEPVSLTIGMRNDGKSAATASYRLAIYDFYGRKLRDDPISKWLPAGATVAVPIKLTQNRRGLFRAVLRQTDTREPESELHFTVLPPQRAIEPKDGSFGAYLTIAPEPLKIAQRMGFRSIAMLTSNRGMNYWDLVERKRGEFTWFDKDVDMARATGFDLVFNLEPCRIPRWASKMTRDERRVAWANYVTEMVRHYKGRVKYWTIGDEVWDLRKKSYKRKCWNSAAEYADWHRSGHSAIKAIDPSAQVVLNGWPGFNADLFKALDPSTVDIGGVNAFHLPDRYLPRARREFDAAGIKKRWAPGIGFGIETFYRRLIAKHRLKNVNDDHWRSLNIRLTKAVVRTFALGFDRFYQYTATYVGNTNKYSWFEADSGLKPTGTQFAALAWLLDGFERAAEVPTGQREKRWSAHRVDRNDGNTVFVLWGNDSSDQSVRLDLDSVDGLTLYDHFTNPLPMAVTKGGVDLKFGREPVFLQVSRKLAAEVETAMRRADYRIDRLPAAKAIAKAGRYAIIEGLQDGLYRHRPNISLWYRSQKLGWVEVMRQRQSSYPGRYEVTERGFRVTWKIPSSAGSFFLEPGKFPADLVDGASYERRLPGKKGERRESGRIDITSKGRTVAEKPQTPAGGSSLVDYVFAMRNGLKVIVDAQPAGSSGAFPQWRLLQRGKGDVFLHKYYKRGEAAPNITTFISVVE